MPRGRRRRCSEGAPPAAVGSAAVGSAAECSAAERSAGCARRASSVRGAEGARRSLCGSWRGRAHACVVCVRASERARVCVRGKHEGDGQKVTQRTRKGAKGTTRGTVRRMMKTTQGKSGKRDRLLDQRYRRMCQVASAALGPRDRSHTCSRRRCGWAAAGPG